MMDLLKWMVAFLIAMPAYATETRMNTLRNINGLTDETDTYTFPGTAVKYSKAIIELGTAGNTDVYGGALKKVGSSTVGLILSRDDSVMTGELAPTFSLIDEWISKASSNTDTKAIIPVPERPIDIIYASKLGGSSWGLRLTTASYLDRKKNDDGPTNTDSRKAEQLDLNLGFSMGSAMDIGLFLGMMGTLSRETDNGTTETEDSFKRGTELGLAFRHRFKGEKMIPFYAMSLSQRKPEVKAKRGTQNESGKFSENILVIEGGTVLRPAKETSVAISGVLLNVDSKGPIIISGSGVGSTGTTAANPSILTNDKTVKRTSQALFARIGAEAPIASQFGILGGLQYAITGTIKNKDAVTTNEPSTETSITETPDAALWSLGLFYDIEKFRLDASYSKGFLHNGPNFVSGNQTNPMLARISATLEI